MALSVKTQKYIWGLFAGRCAICKEAVIHEANGSEASLIGEIAHIVGSRPDSARYDHLMSENERDGSDNLLLLCRKHHKIIDDHEIKYTVRNLQIIRSEHLDWLEGQLQPVIPWRLQVSSFTYLNVPRLLEYAVLQGYRVHSPQVPANSTLHELGFELNQMMEAFRRPLESMAIQSVQADQVTFAHENYIGRIVSFNRLRFRSKNIPTTIPKGGLDLQFSGDLASDPHIYHRFSDWTLIFNIDPRWITTKTAFTLFRPTGGASVCTGFGRVHSVDLENATMTATALVIGMPQSRRLSL